MTDARTPADLRRTRAALDIVDEVRANDELRDRLDHMRRVADARDRVHAFIDLAALFRWDEISRVYDIQGVKHSLALDDLHLLLDGDFTPTHDVKRDNEGETGLHREQAQVQLDVARDFPCCEPGDYAHSKGTRYDVEPYCNHDPVALQPVTVDQCECGALIDGDTGRVLLDTQPSPRGWDRV